jgi:hypothetical protein
VTAIPAISLLDAVRDPNLLGATLPEGLWDEQVRLLESLEDPEIAVHVWALGRGSSKTTLCALASVHAAALRGDLDGVLARGRVRYTLVASPSEGQSREFVRIAAAIVEASPVLSPLATVWADRIDFALDSGARTAIRALPANQASIRGMSASHTIIDEAAHLDTSAGPGSDKRVREALDGSTVPFQDRAVALLISTPAGTAGDFYRMFSDAQSGALPRARVEQKATWEVRPDVSEDYLSRKRRELGEAAFAQELGAQFVSAGGAFFDLEGVHVRDRPARPAEGRGWIASLDPAFHSDSFAVCLVGEDATVPGRLVVGAVEAIQAAGEKRTFQARRGREDAVLAQIAKVIAPYAPTRILSDQHQADAIRSYFARQGYPVKIVPASGPGQTSAFTSTRARIDDGSLLLWRHPTLIEELRRVQVRGESILLPRFGGSHCDCAAALCQAVWELRGVGGPGSGGSPRARRGATITGGLAEQVSAISGGDIRWARHRPDRPRF